MESRLSYAKAAPEAVAAMREVEAYVRRSGLEKPLLEQVKMRASQINGCAYCLDTHSKAARAAGETEQRLYALSAWEEALFYTERERAALAWTEAVTLVSRGHVPEEICNETRRLSTGTEPVDLTMAIVAINGWNRLAICFRAVAGAYQPDRRTDNASGA